MSDKEKTLKIDFEFISILEGSSNEGYVPDPDKSQSGVTIASGFDIGQRSEAEIKKAFQPNLCSKLLPYVGQVRQQAVATLKAKPLNLTDDEVCTINSYSHQEAENRLVSQWNESDCYTPFESLPPACQTVVASVAFQYGSLKLKTPNFWKQVTSGDWQAALGNLKNFGDKYPSRRHKEADVLEKWLLETQES